MAEGLGAHWGMGQGRDFLNFQVKIQGFMHFIAQYYTCGQKLGPGGLIDPWGGAEDVKRTGS